MAIDKAQTPFMPDLLEEERLEIEVVNPESVSIETNDGGVLIDFDPDNPLTGGMNHNSNLAEFIDDQELMDLSSELVAAYMSDKESRKDWEDSYMKGLDLLGLKTGQYLGMVRVAYFIPCCQKQWFAFKPRRYRRYILPQGQ